MHQIELTKRGQLYAARHATTPAQIVRLRPKGCPAGIEPADWRKALCERLERLLDAQTAIIEALDLMDGDPDLEDGADDEPSLGVSSCRARYDAADEIVIESDLEGDELEGWLGETDELHLGEAVDEDGGDINDQPHDAQYHPFVDTVMIVGGNEQVAP